MQNKLKEALENKVLVFDGAMGTARETLHRLESAELNAPHDKTGKVTIYNSSENKELLTLSENLFDIAKKRKD